MISEMGLIKRRASHYEREGILPPAERLQTLADSLGVPVYRLFIMRTEDKNPETDLSKIDPRSVKKIRVFFPFPPMIATISTAS